MPQMIRVAQVVSSTDPGPDDLLVQTRSFEEFYLAERDGLFGAMVLITGNRHEAEEITQEAFLAMWERWDRVSGLEDPVGYLYRTAMNVFRKRLRRAAVALRRAVGRSEQQDVFAAADARHVVTQALAGLSRRQRAALVLTELLGYSSEEAGRALGIKPVTVRVLASQGRAAMRQRVGASDE
jgi:RNA polymerase sigma-70 factor (ECF subfamily)